MRVSGAGPCGLWVLSEQGSQLQAPRALSFTICPVFPGGLLSLRLCSPTYWINGRKGGKRRL